MSPGVSIGDHDLLTQRAIAEIAARLENLCSGGSPPSIEEIWATKLEVCRKHSLDRVPRNSEILKLAGEKTRRSLVLMLRRKSIRTRSGIAVVTAITKPFDCPHGTCTFCPGGVRFGTPQSYTVDSPAASYGISREFDARRQVSDQIKMLSSNGHDTSKIELILLGGTILSMPRDYQRDFVKESYDALNGIPSDSFAGAMRENESAPHRCVGLTIETKPDWCKEEHIDLLLTYGTTRVEIGVQSLSDETLRMVNRGHTVQDTYDAFALARDSSLKIVAHMMPGLPGSNLERDLDELRALVEDERLKPDMLKIYPTLVVEGTALHRQYKIGKYRPYSLEEVVALLRRFKKMVPPWLRIMRIQREIPRHEIADGAKAGNLRQLVLDEMATNGERCRCIRCREVGRARLKDTMPSNMLPSLKRFDYEASFGQEIFLSFEDEKSDTLFGFIRMMIPSGKEHREEIRNQNAALIRELHVYGPVVPVGEKVPLESQQTQHR